jgi:hypothetical protein
VEISDFRAFGEGFALALPPGPGVTLVYGPNGLGKTTFFDAIEWCLTGDVRRFLRHRRGAAARHEQHLTRLGARLPDSHRVSLYFTGAEPIDRGGGLEPANADVVAILKRPEWAEVGDLASYLSLTHFLGQSAAERFSVKPPEKQWETLQAPAGVDRVNFIRERLGGQAARSAFTRQLRDAEDAQQAAQRALADMQVLLETLRRVRSIGRVRDALTPEQVFEECTRVAEVLATVLPHRIALDRSDSPEAWLELMREGVQAARTRADAESTTAGGLDTLVSEIDGVQAERAALRRTIADRTGQRAEYATELAETVIRLHAARTASESSRADLAAAESRVALCDRLFAAAADASLGVARAEGARERVMTTEQRLQELDSSYLRLLIEQEALARRAAERDAAEREVIQLREAARQAAELEQSLADAERELTGIDVVEVLAALVARAANLEARNRLLQAEVRGLEAELDELDRRAAVLASLAEQLRAMLGADDELCPVCATEFAPGELLARAREVTTAPVGSAREVGLRLAAASTELAAAVREAEAVVAERARIEAQRQAMSSAEMRRTELFASVRRVRPDAEVRTFDDVRLLSEMAERSASALFAAIGEQGARDEAVVRRELEDHAAERARLIETRVAAGAELSQRERELDAARLAISQFARELDLSGEPIVAAEEQRLQAVSKASNIVAQVEKAQEELARLESAHRDLTARDREAEQSLMLAVHTTSALEDRLVGLHERWVAAGASGDVSLATAWQLRERAARDERQVREAEERLARIVDAYALWQKDEERARLEAEVAERCRLAGVADEASLDSSLNAALQAAGARVQRIRRVQRAALEIADNLKDEAARFAEGVLQPLNETIRNFSRALMVSADDSLYYRALFRANRSEFRPGVVRRDADGRVATLDRDPNLYFSEGQLSAQSISALLAASTTFRWSRWPGLLLDDPLQHNDVIHASAFIDLLRRLVQKLDYQVILSTHDSDEAEFIARKCEGAGVPFQACQLKSSSTHGVVSV